MSAMGTLYVDRSNIAVGLEGDCLVLRTRDERAGTVPIKLLKRVVVLGSIVVESAALRRLALEGVSVVFLSGRRGRFAFRITGRLHNHGLLRLKQYEKASGDFALEFSKNLIGKKLSAQEEFLQKVLGNAARRAAILSASQVIAALKGRLPSVQEVETLRGIEGGASAQYFAAYGTLFAPSLEFRGRNKRPPRDPVNALLSFLYTLVHFELVREIELIGLDPTIGFYHGFQYGRESLACDLMEPYRPAVDELVWKLFSQKTLKPRDFVRKAGGCYLKKPARARLYPLYEQWAEPMRSFWRQEVQLLARRLLE
jgi:CRISPR-associated protein Cas1